MNISKYFLVGTAVVGAGVSLSNAQGTGTISVHSDIVASPAFSISDAHPAAFNPQVSSFAMMPDGKVVIVTYELVVGDAENTTGVPRTNGKLYLVSNIASSDPEKIGIEEIAVSIKEPTGVAVVDGKIYVAEKTQLTEYTLGAAGAKATARKVADIPVDPLGTVNFQEFSFGLLFRDGYFYTATGGGVRIGGKSYFDDLSKISEPKRDGLLKIKAADGTSELLNGGLRAPNGLAYGPKGTMWVTDNQGSFVPACKLIQVVEGRNYGYPNGPNKYREMEETPPAVWFPYGEIGKSITNPIYVKKGPYAGQFLMGDISFGGLIRAAVEEVNGQYQGSAHSVTGGLAAGMQSAIELDDGTFILGGLGKGDVANWGWRGKLRGLQKMVPKAGAENFEMLALRSKSDGIEIEFTKPVGSGAEAIGMYTMFYGKMVSGPNYGEGNMVGKTIIPIKGIRISQDKKRVLLQADGLVPKSVIAVKVAGMKSSGAEDLFRPAAWYTLNSVSTVAWSDATGINDRAKARGMDPESILAKRMGRGISVKVPFAGDHVVTLRTLRGEALDSRSGRGAGEYMLGGSGIGSGVYLIDVKVGGQLLRKSVVF